MPQKTTPPLSHLQINLTALSPTLSTLLSVPQLISHRTLAWSHLTTNPITPCAVASPSILSMSQSLSSQTRYPLSTPVNPSRLPHPLDLRLFIQNPPSRAQAHTEALIMPTASSQHPYRAPPPIRALCPRSTLQPTCSPTCFTLNALSALHRSASTNLLTPPRLVWASRRKSLHSSQTPPYPLPATLLALRLKSSQRHASRPTWAVALVTPPLRQMPINNHC